MAASGTTGWTRIIRAFGYSRAGWQAAWQHEAAFQQEVILCVALVPTGLWLGQTALERALLISSLIFVLIVELINSAVEATIDRIGAERHPLSGRAKDMGSAAVLLACVCAVILWGAVISARFSA